MYLVTGGYGGGGGLSSTEMMVKGASSWTVLPDSLPARMRGLRSISVDNQIITTGKLEKLVDIICEFDQNSIDILYQLCIYLCNYYFQEVMMLMLVRGQTRF